MWKHDDKIHVNDPTLKMRIVQVGADPELLQLMSDEMERVKRQRNIFWKLFGGMNFISTFVFSIQKGN